MSPLLCLLGLSRTTHFYVLHTSVGPTGISLPPEGLTPFSLKPGENKRKGSLIADSRDDISFQPFMTRETRVIIIPMFAYSERIGTQRG